MIYTGAAEPAGHSGRRLPDERRGRRGKALGSRSDRYDLSAHDQQDPGAVPQDKGVAAEDIKINYTPFGFSDWQTEVAAIKEFGSAGKKTAVVSTINGDANVPFYKELANEGIKAEDIPVVAFSVGEEELAGFDTSNLVGHLAAWNYFQSVDTPANAEFIRAGTSSSRTTSAPPTTRWKRPIWASSSGSRLSKRPARPILTPC